IQSFQQYWFCSRPLIHATISCFCTMQRTPLSATRAQIHPSAPNSSLQPQASCLSNLSPPASNLQFLIANLELEFPPTHSKQRSGAVSNRKFSRLLRSPRSNSRPIVSGPLLVF